MANLDNVKHIKDKFFDTKGEVVKIEDSKGVVWKRDTTPPVEDRLKGTWKFNDELINEKVGNIITKALFNFISDNKLYNRFSLVTTGTGETMTINYSVDDDNTIVYDLQKWASQKYRTIEVTSTYDELICESPLPGIIDNLTKEEFMTWLEANATKIA